MNERFGGLSGKHVGGERVEEEKFVSETDFALPENIEKIQQPTEAELSAVFDTLPNETREAIQDLPDAPTNEEMIKVIDALPHNTEKTLNLPDEVKKTIETEASFSERFSGIAKKAARVLGFITALSAVPGIVQAAGLTGYEQAKAARQAEYKARTGVDLAQRGVLQEEQRRQLEAQKEAQGFENAVNQETLKEQRVTSSGSWGEEFVVKAESDIGRVKDTQDAEWLARTYINGFVREYHQPSPGKGVMERFDAHRIHRVFSSGDLEKLKTDALHLKGILDTLNTRYSIQGYDTHMSNLNTVIRDLEIRGKYSNQMEEKAYREINSRMIQNHGGQYGGPQHYGGQRYMRKFH